MNDLRAEEKYWVWLSGIDGVFAKWFYILQSVYIEPQGVWERAGNIQKDIPNFPPKIAEVIRKARDEGYFDSLFETIEQFLLTQR